MIGIFLKRQEKKANNVAIMRIYRTAATGKAGSRDVPAQVMLLCHLVWVRMNTTSWQNTRENIPSMANQNDCINMWLIFCQIYSNQLSSISNSNLTGNATTVNFENT